MLPVRVPLKWPQDRALEQRPKGCVRLIQKAAYALRLQNPTSFRQEHRNVIKMMNERATIHDVEGAVSKRKVIRVRRVEFNRSGTGNGSGVSQPGRYLAEKSLRRFVLGLRPHYRFQAYVREDDVGTACGEVEFPARMACAH